MTYLVIISLLLIVSLILAYFLYDSISKQKKMKKILMELHYSCEKISQESRLKDKYIHNMSHEIRTPLNAVVGFAQLMAMPDEIVSPKEKEEYNNYIAQNSSLLQLIIDDILNISDIKAGRYKISKSLNPLNQICSSAIACVNCRVGENVSLSFTSDFDDSYMLNTDVRRVQQILINFLSNAIKHTADGSITLHCSRDENPGMVTFSVTDTGEGVPEEKADDIFGRFIKLNDFVEGTGIGLNICLTLAEKLGGKVYLDKNYKEQGARFVFAHPIEQQ